MKKLSMGSGLRFVVPAIFLGSWRRILLSDGNARLRNGFGFCRSRQWSQCRVLDPAGLTQLEHPELSYGVVLEPLKSDYTAKGTNTVLGGSADGATSST